VLGGWGLSKKTLSSSECIAYNQDMTFRANIISPITWTLIILVFGWPLSALACLPARFFWNDDVFLSLSFIVVLVCLTLVWVYFLTLRVTVKNGRLEKSSLLRTTSVILDEKTLIRYRAEETVVEGVNVSAALAGALSRESTTHIQITIRDTVHQIKVGSALKGILKLRDHLISFEADTILPATMKRLQIGEKVTIEPFEFQNLRVTCRGESSEVPLQVAPEMKLGMLHFQIASKRRKVALKKIWNPMTCLHLLTQGLGTITESHLF